MRRPVHIVVGLAALMAIAGQVRAAERIALSNGFSLPCNHHGLTDGKMRLFTGAGDDSYIEVAPEEIARIEIVPDPPPETTPKPVADKRSTSSNLTDLDLNEMLTNAGHQNNLDVDLLVSLVKAESGGNTRAMSHAGARGLMQLMPGTAAGLGVDDSFEPQQNVRGGSTYLDSLLTRYHDNIALALAAYNAGPAAVDKYRGIPPYRETQLYVARVIREFNRRVLAREVAERRAFVVASGSR